MAEAPGTASAAGRAYALDALRGMAILAMLLSGQEPFGHNALPAWMYHGQEPPPYHNWLGKVPGITWVDLVFPIFLFCMGAAFPLALSRRMDQGFPKWRLGWLVLERGFLLAFFALYVMAIRPSVLSNQPGNAEWAAGLLGFLLLFPVLTRLPDAWSAGTKWLVKAAGWCGVVLFLALARYPDGSGFSFKRTDVIIVVLCNMAVFGSLVWMLTRRDPLVRLGIIGVIIALRLSVSAQPMTGWVTALWHFCPAIHWGEWNLTMSWIYQFSYVQYLCIVIPGTIAGDLILDWIRAVREPGAAAIPAGWGRGRCLAIAGLMVGLVVVVLCGLEARETLPGTPEVPSGQRSPEVFSIDGAEYMRTLQVPATLLAFALCGAGAWLLRRPGNEIEKLHRRLFGWGAYWLVLGLAFEPWEGGIKKDHPTLSYYFVTAGLAHCLLIAFSVLIDRFKVRRGLQLLIDNGQNPMIAYAGINNFIIPVLALTAADRLLQPLERSPWGGFLHGLIITLLMAAVVSVLSRLKIFWRT